MSGSLKDRYGSLALVAGASEGLGAAFSTYLASEGFDLILIARRAGPLEKLADLLKEQHHTSVTTICVDLSETTAATQLHQQLKGREIGLLVYNAAIPYIGRFEEDSQEHNLQIANANMVTPMLMSHMFGVDMLRRGKGALILMSSLAGFQGSGFLAAYAATKAYNRVLAESLWYEWKDQGVDVIACCAGATATPNYMNTKPEKSSFLAPPVQTPEEVVKECFEKLGKEPSFITGMGNKIATFFMQKILPRKMAINIISETTRKMYRLR